MPTGVFPLVIEQGVELSLPIVVGSADNSSLMNLTGHKARLQARETYDSPTPFINATTENDITDGAWITLGTTNGTITLHISAAFSSSLTNYCGVYDLEVYTEEVIGSDTVEHVTRILQGTVKVSREVTRG